MEQSEQVDREIPDAAVADCSPPVPSSVGSFGSQAPPYTGGESTPLQTAEPKRKTVELAPSRSFNPNPEEVLRWSIALARSTRRFHPKDFIRIHLRADNGYLSYLLSAPSEVLPRLLTFLPAGLTVREAAVPPSPAALAVSRAVVSLPRNPRVVPADPDVLGDFARALAEAREGELAEVILDLVAADKRPRERQFSSREWDPAKLLTAARTAAARDFLARPQPTRSNPREEAENHPPTEEILFRVAVHAHAFSPDAQRARDLALGLAQPFHAWGPGGSVKVSTRSPAAGWLHEGHRPRGARSQVVAQTALACLLLPPTESCTAMNVRRSGAAAPPPRGLLPLGPGTRPLGHVAGYSGPVGIRWDEFFFGGLSGQTRWGKSYFEIGTFLSWVLEAPYGLGLGGCYVDPTREALGTLEPFMTSIAPRCLVVDLGRNWDDLYLPCWNLLDARGTKDQEANERVGAMTSGFLAATKWKPDFASRATAIITNTANSLIAFDRALPADAPTPTIFQIHTLIENEEWRKKILPCLPQHLRQWWEDSFPRLPKDAVLTVTNLISRLRNDVPTAAFLGGRNTLNLREAMDRRQVVLFSNARKGDGRDALPTSLFVRGLLMAGHSRQDTPEVRRREECPRFHIVYDEAPTYNGPDLASGMQELGKYGIVSDVLSQGPSKLKVGGTWDALATNSSTLTTTSVGHDDAVMIAKEWQGASASDIMDTERYTFLTSVVHEGRHSPAFHFRAIDPHDLYPYEAGVLERSIAKDRRYRLASETVADLETLDERLVKAWMRGQNSGPRPIAVDVES
jgi:hypothetical protein